MSKSDSDFELFKSEFTKWQKHFGLNGWKVYFKYESIDGAFGDIDINLAGMVATVRYNSKLSKKDRQHKDTRATAKHEALHLLIGRIEFNGRGRFVSCAEMDESAEELVRKLENLIQ